MKWCRQFRRNRYDFHGQILRASRFRGTDVNRTIVGTAFLFSLIGANLHSQAAIVRLDSTSGGLGELIDDYTSPTPSSMIIVPGISPELNLTIIGFGPNGSINSTQTSLGINAAGGGDDSDAFDVGEFLTLRFDQDVTVSQLDFTTFQSGEMFEFAGFSISNGDLSNGTTDVFDFATPLAIAANTEFTMRATSGTIGIEAFDVHMTAVPEPTSIGFLTAASVLVIGLRRKRSRQTPTQ